MTHPQQRRRMILLVATAACAAATVGVSSAATVGQPGPAVVFTKVQYDSPGPDTGTNASLNGEWFQLTNKGSKPVSLNGWYVRDVANHVYRLSGSLAASKTLTVRTGRGTANQPAGNRYWGSRSYIWNNTGDTATLRNAAGKTVHSCKWGRGTGVTTCGASATPTYSPPPAPKPTAPAPTPSTSSATPPIGR